MATPKSKAVDRYIAKHPKTVQAALKRIRSALRNALPGAEEVISYQIPAYRINGRLAVFFAGWREHTSLYPASYRAIAAFKRALAKYEVRKGTIRFSLTKAVPAKLIQRIAKYRAKQLASR